MHSHTHLYLTLIFICLCFNSGVGTFPVCTLWNSGWGFRASNLGTAWGCSSWVHWPRLQQPPVSSAVSKISHFPFWCLRPITFIFDLTNRCSQTLFMMGRLPSGVQADGVYSHMITERDREMYFPGSVGSTVRTAVCCDPHPLTSRHFLLVGRCRDEWATHEGQT